MDTSSKLANFCSKCGISFTGIECPKCSRRMFLPKKIFFGVTFLALSIVFITILVFQISPDFKLSSQSFMNNISKIFSNDKVQQDSSNDDLNKNESSNINSVTNELNTYILTKKVRKINPQLNQKLFDAWSSRNMEEVAKLLDKGADANIKISSAFGGTALHDAVVMKNVSIVKMLLEYCADVNAKTENGSTPLNLVFNRAHSIEITKFLLANGADINARDHLGRTVLIVAVDKKNVNMVKFLVGKGADVNVRYTKYNKGDSILHKALECHNVKIVKLLVDAGADINAKGKNGESPYSFIVKRNYSKRQQRQRKYLKELMEIKEILETQKNKEIN